MSVGGQILANLQQSVTRTLVPSGVEWVAPGSGAATQQIIAGVVLSGQHDHDRSEVSDVTSDLEPGIRILVPGEKNSEVTVTLLSNAGKKVEFTANLSAKKVTQLPTAGVPDGVYTVIITGQEPLVAGVRTVQDSSAVSPLLEGTPAATPSPTVAPELVAPSATIGGGDFTWIASSSYLTDTVLIPVPAGPAPVVSFYNPANRTAEVTMSAPGQKDVVLTVKAGEMASGQLVADVRYTTQGAKGLVGGMTFIGSGFGSSIALNPANVLGSSITVYTR